jgi:hypothetical protein
MGLVAGYITGDEFCLEDYRSLTQTTGGLTRAKPSCR